MLLDPFSVVLKNLPVPLLLRDALPYELRLGSKGIAELVKLGGSDLGIPIASLPG